MTQEELKAEWLEKVKITNKQNIYNRRGSYYTANTAFYQIPEELEKDLDIIKTALIEGKEFLWAIPYEVIDRNLINYLIENNYANNIYQHLPYSLKDDTELFRKAIERKEDLGYGKLSDVINKNRELILETLPEKDFFGKLHNYSNDKQIMRIMLENHDYRFKELSKSMNKIFSKDRDLVLKLICSQEGAYKALPENLQLDPEIIDTFVKKSVHNFSELHPSLLSNKEFLMEALPKYKANLYCASKELKEDYELVSLNVAIDGRRLQDCKAYSTDVTLARLALKTYPQLSNVPKILWTNKELVLEYLHANPKNCKTLYENSYHFREDYEIMKLVVAVEPTALHNYPNWQKEKELCEIAALHNNKDISLLSKEHLNNKVLVLDFLTHDNKNIDKLFRVTKQYNNDQDIMEIACKANPKLIAKSPKFKADKDFINKAISLGLSEIQYIDPGLLNDKEIAKEFLSIRTDNYPFLPLSLKEDKDITYDLLKFGGNNKFEKDMYDLIVDNSRLGESQQFHIEIMKHSPEYYDLLPDNCAFKLDKRVILAYLTSVEDHNIAGKNFKPYLPKEICDQYGVDTNHAYEVKYHLAKEFMEQIVPNKTIKEEVKTKKKI